MSTNIETVQSIYAAFGRGDVPAILATLAEDVDWEYAPPPTDLPWLQRRRGRANVGGFFEAVMKELDITRFAVNAIAEGTSLVIALVDVDYTARRTGRTGREIDEPHVWHFDAAGRVTRFRHGADTHQQWLAWKL
jgi:uncharacterized protein